MEFCKTSLVWAVRCAGLIVYSSINQQAVTLVCARSLLQKYSVDVFGNGALGPGSSIQNTPRFVCKHLIVIKKEYPVFESVVMIITTADSTWYCLKIGKPLWVVNSVSCFLFSHVTQTTSWIHPVTSALSLLCSEGDDDGIRELPGSKS